MGQRYAPHLPSPTRRVLEAARPVRMEYVEAADLPRWLATSTEHPLAIISFGAPVQISTPCPVVTLDLPELSGHRTLEVWSCDQPVTVLRERDFCAAVSTEVVAATIQEEEDPGMGLRWTTEQTYRKLVERLRALGFPHLWRIWNYFPAINDTEQGLERYRQFCVGRHQALADTLAGFPGTVPAGTAVGTRSGPLQIHALAGSRPATHLGNPRQIHAYEYPRQYGPCSPSFARATLCRFDASTHLFLAGTASVVGHQSRHVGLPESQARETVANIRTLVAHAGESLRAAGPNHSWHGGYKVYIRHPEHLSAFQQVLRNPFFASSRLVFLQAELCRQELLIEIEGLVSLG